MKSKVSKKAVKLSSKRNIGSAHAQRVNLELRLIDGYQCANRSNGGGVYLDNENNVYVTEDDSKPKRTTIRAALEFMARRHGDGPESFTDGDPIGMGEWFQLLASKLPQGV